MTDTTAHVHTPVAARQSTLDRLLPVWIAVAMGLGLLLVYVSLALHRHFPHPSPPPERGQP